MDDGAYGITGPAAEPERSLDLVINVTHKDGKITAACQPTLHSFLTDLLPTAGFHVMRAVCNAIQEEIDRGPTG